MHEIQRAAFCLMFTSVEESIVETEVWQKSKTGEQVRNDGA
jgi:hypothetical protein